MDKANLLGISSLSDHAKTTTHTYYSLFIQQRWVLDANVVDFPDVFAAVCTAHSWEPWSPKDKQTECVIFQRAFIGINFLLRKADQQDRIVTTPPDNQTESLVKRATFNSRVQVKLLHPQKSFSRSGKSSLSCCCFSVKITVVFCFSSTRRYFCMSQKKRTQNIVTSLLIDQF